jgi:Rieske Fe-S protein
MLNRLEAISEACANCVASRGEKQDSVTIGRRQFISGSVMAAAAAALAACGGSSNVTAPGSVGFSLKISDYAALATVGGVALVESNGSPIAVVRTGATTFVALSRICPHQGSTVNVTANGFLCPNHGATFTSTGTWTGGQRTSNMRSYTTSYDSVTGTLAIA